MASAAEQLASNLNFGALAKADELKKRIWFTLGALIVYRLGTYIPLPGMNPDAVADLFKQTQSGVLGLFNMFSGGAVGRLAIFALAIMPYISASIIVQLLSSVVPTFEALKKEGEAGRKILNQYTRYLTLVLALFQAWGIGVGLQGSGNLVLEPGLELNGDRRRPGPLRPSQHVEISVRRRSGEYDDDARGLVDRTVCPHDGCVPITRKLTREDVRHDARDQERPAHLGVLAALPQGLDDGHDRNRGHQDFPLGMRPRAWIDSRSPIAIRFATMAEPPTVTNGSAIPVTGAMPIVMPTFTKT